MLRNSIPRQEGDGESDGDVAAARFIASEEGGGTELMEGKWTDIDEMREGDWL